MTFNASSIRFGLIQCGNGRNYIWSHYADSIMYEEDLLTKERSTQEISVYNQFNVILTGLKKVEEVSGINIFLLEACRLNLTKVGSG